MSDILTVQEFLYNGLLSCDLFAAFPVTLERQFLMQSELEYNSIWQAPRVAGGQVGIGLIVEMPKLQIPKPNSLQRNLVQSIGIIEERNLNMTAGAGTLTAAEDLAVQTLDFMFGWMLGLSSGLTPELGTVLPAPDLIKADGLVTYRVKVSLRYEHRPGQRCDMPTITEGPTGTFSLVNGPNTPAAAIYYTTDGSFPGVSNVLAAPATGGATLYTGPVALAAGTKLLFCAWQSGLLPSHIGAVQIS